MEPFLEVWRAQVVPARRAHGYRIDGAWRDDAEDVFAWVVSYDGPERWEDKEAVYYASPERTRIDPPPTIFLADVQTRLMRPADPG